MGLFGWAIAGGSGFGPSKMWQSLPYKNWKELTTWVEEFIDACGYRFDVLEQRFISPTARSRLIDPAYTSTDVATQYLATATAAPQQASSTDTVLDVLLYIVLGIGPADSNLSIAQKQALAQVGWDALQRKGTRHQLLNLSTQITEGVGLGWTMAPNNFSILVGDGTPDPGWGSWVQSNNTTAEIIRPWTFNAVRSSAQAIIPAFESFGIGFSQFRAGYSGAGETVMPTGSRINILANEHFSSWTAGVPDNWTKTGTATLTQSTSAARINWEFTGSAAILDLTAASISQFAALSQTATYVDNKVTHHFQLDYAYTNSQNVGVLAVQITDVNRDGNTYYWNNSTNAWQTSVYKIIAPPSSTRARLAFDVVMQAASSSSLLSGTAGVTIAVSALCDGTATTQTTYTLYRVGLYEKFDLNAETLVGVERTSSYPLVDAPGWTTMSRSGGGSSVIEPANADRSSYKVVSATQGTFPYSAALSKRSFLATSTWTNLIKGSNDFNSDWTLTNATRTANAVISPLVGESVASASRLNATSTNAKISQGSLGTPTSKSYVGGVWVKKISSDGNFSDVTLSLVSTSTKSTAYTLTQAQGWKLLPIQATFGGGDVAALQFQIAWGAASSNGQIAVASAYLYEVTGKPAVLYPPVCQTAVAATGTVNPTSCSAVTSGVALLHPLTLRPLASTVRGVFASIVEPTFDAASQPNGVIFDIAQSATANRVVLRVNSGALELKRWDAAGNTWTASLTLTANPSPSAGSATWLRNTAISIRAFWDENTTQLSVANGNASGTKPGTWAPDDSSLTALTIGCDFTSANQFDGIISDG